MHHVLTLDQGGRPARWSTWEEAVTYKVKGLITWWLGDETAIRGGVSRKTGEDSIVFVPNIIALKNQVFTGTIALTNQNLFNRDAFVCCYCGCKFPRAELTREHIVPVSRGGPNTWMNCVTACKACNGGKGDKLLEETGLKLRYLPYAPVAAEALLLAGRNIQADQMEFLQQCLPAASPLKNRH